MNQAVDVILYVLMKEKGVNSDPFFEMIGNGNLKPHVITELLRVCKRQWLSVTEKLIGKERAKTFVKPLISLTDKWADLHDTYQYVISLLLKEKETMNMDLLLRKACSSHNTDNFDLLLDSTHFNYTNPFYCVELKQFTYFVKPFESLLLNPYLTKDQLESICDPEQQIQVHLQIFSPITALPLSFTDLAYVRFQGRLILPPIVSEEAAEHPSLEFWVFDAVPCLNSVSLSIVSSYANESVTFGEGMNLTEEFKMAHQKQTKLQIQIVSIQARPFVARLCIKQKSSVFEVADRIQKGPLGSFVVGVDCQHAQEVDLYYFLDHLSTQPQFTKWLCPYCKSSLHPYHMISTKRQRYVFQEDYEYPFTHRNSSFQMLF